ncbi:hypothetical protein D3C84_838280 [compost metagenome]
MQLVAADHATEVAEVVLALQELVRSHRIEAVQTVTDAGTHREVKRIEQVHASAVVRQFFVLISGGFGVEVNQQTRHPPWLHHRDQGVVERHQQAQRIDQRPPESLLAQRGKHTCQPLVHRQLFQQRVHALPLSSNP